MALSDQQDTVIEGRKESKFWLPVEVATEVECCVAKKLPLDKFRDGGHEFQTGTTIYLDTPDFRLMKAAEADKTPRFKLRIRQYGFPPDGKVFLEIKEKDEKGQTTKRRADVKEKYIRGLILGNMSTRDFGESEEEQAAIQAFIKATRKSKAGPVLLTRSQRMAYSEDGRDTEEGCRATFDRRMSCTKSEGVKFDVDAERWRGLRLPSSQATLLELKYPDSGGRPGWMETLIKQWDLREISHSKMLNAAKVLGML